jgi:hypothetical protein
VIQQKQLPDEEEDMNCIVEREGTRLLALAMKLGQPDTVQLLLSTMNPFERSFQPDVSERMLQLVTSQHFLTPSLEALKIMLKERGRWCPFPLDRSITFKFVLKVAGMGYTEVLKYLISVGAPVHDARIMRSRRFGLITKSLGDAELVKLLLEHGGRISPGDLQTSIRKGYPQSIKLLLEYIPERNTHYSRNYLAEAASLGDLETVRILLDAGFDPNIGDKPPLVRALESERPAIVKLLVERGADFPHVAQWALKQAAAAGLDSMSTLIRSYVPEV